jgi:hypothetical protein
MNKFKIGDKVGIDSPSIIKEIYNEYKEPIYALESCLDNSSRCHYESELYLIEGDKQDRDIKSKSHPAFPCKKVELLMLGDSTGHSQEVTYPGMSLRDYLAAKAMQGLIANPNPWINCYSPEEVSKKCAKLSYEYADAMLIER